LTEWEYEDTEIAKKVYESLSPVAREIYDRLFDWAETGLTVEDLAETTGKKPSQIRGALSWPAAHAKSFGKVPIHSQMPDGKNIFVAEKVAQIFAEALGRNYSKRVKLICPNSHEWDTTATEGGMAKPVPGDSKRGAYLISYELDHCPTCGKKGTIKR
jgi:hypothetical protein